jgi:hypothetical protein
LRPRFSSSWSFFFCSQKSEGKAEQRGGRARESQRQREREREGGSKNERERGGESESGAVPTTSWWEEVVVVEGGELEEVVGARGKEEVTLGNRRTERKVGNKQWQEGT